MAKLRDLVDVNINRDVIKIQGVEFPVIFTFESFPYLQEAYGKPYGEFEKDLNEMLKGEVTVGEKETKIMSALIYSMIRSGGTEATFDEVKGAIPLHDLVEIFKVIMPIFNRQMFQTEDADKVKTEKKS